MKKPKTPAAPAPMPVLSTLEWGWLFQAAAANLADALANDIENLDRVERQVRIHGDVIPPAMFPTTKRSAAELRQSHARSREIHAKLLAAARVLCGRLDDAEAEAFGEQVAEYFRRGAK